MKHYDHQKPYGTINPAMNAVAGTPAPEPERPLLNALALQDKLLAELHENITMLEERLAPARALRPAQPVSEAPKADGGTLLGIAHMTNDRLVGASNRLREIRDTLTF